MLKINDLLVDSVRRMENSGNVHGIESTISFYYSSVHAANSNSNPMKQELYSNVAKLCENKLKEFLEDRDPKKLMQFVNHELNKLI